MVELLFRRIVVDPIDLDNRRTTVSESIHPPATTRWSSFLASRVGIIVGVDIRSIQITS